LTSLPTLDGTRLHPVDPSLVTFASGPRTHRYRPGALLGQGSSGSIYRATCIETGQTVAIKLLREDAAQPAPTRQRLRLRFERETRLCERLHHPHVVALLDKGETPDRSLFAVFEFVPGRTLRDVLRAGGALPAVTTGLLMTQVLDGLASAHRAGVVHRDLKPQNLMVATIDGAPHAKILDFGIGALLPDMRHVDEPTLTHSDDVLGTPQYCAPEQLRNEAPTVASDLYAWGLMVIECLTGQAVMQGASVADILYQQLSPVDVALPPPIAAHPLGTVLRLALNKDPRHRAGSADELLERFRDIHFPALVGEFGYGPARRKPPSRTRDSARVAAPHATSAAAPMTAASAAAAAPGGERRQVTALCCSVTIAGADGLAAAPRPDLLDAYEAQWLTRCADIAIRYGGQVAGMLGDTLLFYFGYPDAIDHAARRAARAAFDIVRTASIVARPPPDTGNCAQRLRVEIAAALHAGMLFSQTSTRPVGALSAEAVRLLRRARPGQILLSDDARRLLERYVDYGPTSLQFATAGAAPRPVHALLGERHEHVQFASLDQRAGVPMIGRERERNTLIRAWHAFVAARSPGAAPAAGKRPDAPLIVGAAGIGKSRLVHELCEAVRAERRAFARCVCLPEQMNDALFPVLCFVRSHWRIDTDGPPEAALARLDRMLAPLDCDHAAARATLAVWFGIEMGSGGAAALRGSGAHQQQMLFEVLRQLLASIDGGAPVLLVIEDVQWIDRATADFLAALCRHPGGKAVWVVLTSRPENLARWRGLATRLVLRRLSRADTRKLITALFAHDDIDPASLDFLAHRTAGIPLFVEEIIRELHASGAATEPGRPLAGLASSGHDPLPGSLRDMLDLSFERVDGARDTAQLAATIGLEVDTQLLAAASPHDAVVLEEHLQRLLEARVVYARHRLGGVSYAFRHALVRDAAYGSMPARLCRNNHERVAHALAASAGNPARIADHFAAASLHTEAVWHGLRAARRALERALHDDAIRYAQTVHTWLEHCRHADRELDAARADLMLTHARMARFGWAAAEVRDQADPSPLQANRCVTSADIPRAGEIDA
jgi:TOMM system kinase/cyclase fusion protein